MAYTVRGYDGRIIQRNAGRAEAESTALRVHENTGEALTVEDDEQPAGAGVVWEIGAAEEPEEDVEEPEAEEPEPEDE